MSEPTNTAATEETLNGIPGIGPARRALLIAAGISSRAALQVATVEQLISVTGMPRAQAEQALSTVQTPLIENAPLRVLPLSTPIEPSTPESEPPFDAERSLLAAQAALSEVSRMVRKKHALTKSLTRLALLLERLSLQVGAFGPKRQARLAERLDRLTQRLERAAAPTEPLKPERAKRLRERLKSDRQELSARYGQPKRERKHR